MFHFASKPRLLLAPRITSLNTFGSLRDLAVWIAAIALAALVVVILLEMARADADSRTGAALGLVVSSLLMRLMMLPVRARCLASNRAILVERIADLRFLACQDGVYRMRAPRWTQWDNNAISLSLDAAGNTLVTAPLYLIWSLRRSQLPAQVVSD